LSHENQLSQMRPRLHENELPIESGLVRSLIDRQFPQFAALPVRRLEASGSSNLLFRLGQDWLVRLPRQAGGGVSILKEHRWLPFVSQHLSVAVPTIIAIGTPDLGFSEHWSIVPWLEGGPPATFATDSPASAASLRLGLDLAEVVLSLRSLQVLPAAVADPALRGYRGRSLAGFDKQMRLNVEQCRTIDGLDLDLDRALTIWDTALSVPGSGTAGPERWYHGDLVAENLLVTDGRLTAVLDFGSLGIGDPTVDLHGAWEILDPPAREIFRARVGADDAEWLRGRAWALAIALGTFPYYWKTMPARMRDRLAMARSALADAT